LKALAQQTGGTAFFPGSLGHLNRSLNSLREVIRSRYLISYKPAQFAWMAAIDRLNLLPTNPGGSFVCTPAKATSRFPLAALRTSRQIG
jgi:hypothetical protein